MARRLYVRVGRARPALFRRNDLEVEIHRVDYCAIDLAELPDDPYPRGAWLLEAQSIRMGERRFVPEAWAGIAWHLIVGDESGEASRHAQVIAVGSGTVATPDG